MGGDRLHARAKPAGGWYRRVVQGRGKGHEGMEHRCDLRINAAVEQEAVLLVLQRSTTQSHRYTRAQQAVAPQGLYGCKL